uniref:Transposase n=1 Tax=Panagrellus redivivus TaxID=6233 RepID=A0A7E4V3H3_PANRE
MPRKNFVQVHLSLSLTQMDALVKTDVERCLTGSSWLVTTCHPCLAMTSNRSRAHIYVKERRFGGVVDMI